jgi:hypothetical protein
MTSNLSSHTEEHFEFVDYTSVSNFERLIACIEDAVSSWGLKDGRYGLDDSIQQETLLFNDEVYELCYSINSNREETKVEMPLADTILFSENYALHQWTGLKRILVLKPTQQSLKTKLFLSQRPTIELYQAKNLISACAIAFQNMGCRVPVFVPVGQARYNLYIGYMLTTQQPKGALNETEVRFNMSLTIPTTNTTANINNLKDAFIQKLGLFREEYGNTNKKQVKPAMILICFKN